MCFGNFLHRYKKCETKLHEDISVFKAHIKVAAVQKLQYIFSVYNMDGSLATLFMRKLSKPSEGEKRDDAAHFT